MAYNESFWGSAADPVSMPSSLKPMEDREEEEKDFGFFDYAGDIAAAPFRGIAGAVEGIAEIGNIIPGVDYDIAANLGLGESKTFVGGAIEGITEFATAFIPVAGWVGRGAKVAGMAGKAGKGVKLAGGLEKAAKLKGAKGWAARRSQEAIAGGIADFAVIQGHEARLSDLIEQFPGLQNPVTEFLQSDEDDPEIVGRLKAAVEGLGAGIVFDSFLLGMKALRKGKQAFNDGVAKGLSEEAADKKAAEAMDEVQRTEEPGVSAVSETAYHGTDGEPVGELLRGRPKGSDKGVFGDAVYLTSSPETAKFYGENVVEAGVNLKNPLVLSGDKVSAAERASKELGVTATPDWDGATQKNAEWSLEFTDRAKAQGYDGVVWTDPQGAKEFAVFDDVPLRETAPKTLDDAAGSGGKPRQLTTQDGFKFYELPDGRIVDDLDPDMVDMEYPAGALDRFMTETGATFADASPHSMTAHEFVLHKINQREVEGLRETLKAFDAEEAGESIESFLKSRPSTRNFVDEARAEHRQSVEFALSKGDPVPQRVLDEYPDLGKGSGGKPPEVPPGRAAGDGGDVPDPSGDVGAVQARREELDVEGVIDVQTGRLNLRGVAGEPKKIIRAVEDALSDQIDAELGDMSDAELIADNLESLADMMGISPEQLSREIGSDRSSVRAVNRRVLAYKKVIETMTDDRLKPALDAVKKAQQETGTVDAETLLRAEHELAAISEVITAMRGLRREQSQGLRIMKYSEVFFDVANAGDTADALARGRDALLEELGGREGLVKRIETITALLEHGGLDAALKGLKKQRGNKYLLMLNEGFINNILSGPKTLTTNFMGPMLVSMYRPLENALGGLLTGDAKIVRRSLREFTGLFSGWSDSLRMARMALANDELILDPTARQVDLPGSQRRAISAAGMEISENSGAGKILDVIGKALGLPTRALGGTDEFVKQLNYRSVVRADLTEQGIEKGLSGVQLAEFVDNGMDNIVINGAALTARNLDREATKMGLSGAEKTKFIAERIEASDPALAQRALDIAREVTFTRELSPDQSQFRKLSRKAQMAVNAHPGLRPFIPFIRTPVNLLSFAGERTVDQAMGLVRLLNPLSRTTPKEFKIAHGNRSRLMADLASEDPQRRAEAYGRTMAGLAFTATGVGLTATGNLTGGGPKDYKQRKLLEEAGWQPYSIKVGDDYYSYQRMDPFASMLGIFADISDINRYAPPEMQAEVENVGLNMAIAVARNIGSKTYLQGVMDLAGLMENPERFVGSTTRKFAGSMVPFSGLLGQGVQAVGGDESMREVRTMLDAMQAKIPFLSDGLDPQRNFMGEPSERYMALGGRWTDWWLPIVHSTTSSDPINREVAALGHTFSPPSSNRYNEDLRQIVSPSGQSAYDRWMELHQEVRIGGRSLNQAMNRLIRSAKYRRMSAEGFGDEKSPRVREINKLVSRYRAKAEAQMLREFPQVNTAKKNKMVTRRSLRTGQSADSIRASLFPLD